MAPLEKQNRRAIIAADDRGYFVRQRLLKLRARYYRHAEQLDGAPKRAWSQPYALTNSMRLPTLEPVPLRVRCSGALHRVSITLCGRITFHNHTRHELRALKTLRVLGDKTCGCLEVAHRVTRERWHPKYKAFVLFTQKTLALRSQLDSDWRKADAFVQPAPHERRAARHRVIIRALREKFDRPQYLDYLSDVANDGALVGVSDATHPPTMKLVPMERFDSSDGWVVASRRLVVVVPLDWSLQLGDKKKTAFIQQHVCTKFLNLGDKRGLARVWKRTGLLTFEETDCPVIYNAVEHAWKFEQPFDEWEVTR